MVELAHHQPLAMHALDEARVLGHVTEQHLESDGSVEADLVSLVDGAHGAFAELLEQAEIAEHRALLALGLSLFGPPTGFLVAGGRRPDWRWSVFHALYHNRPRSRCHAFCACSADILFTPIGNGVFAEPTKAQPIPSVVFPATTWQAPAPHPGPDPRSARGRRATGR